MKSAPLTLEPKTAEYLRRALAGTEEGFEPVLTYSEFEGGSDPETGAQFEYRGPAVTLGWYRSGEMPPDSFFELCGFAISIPPSTLQQIENKTITRVRFDTSFPKGPPHYYVLIVG